MLSIRGGGVRLCDGINRREVLRIGGLGFTGLMWSDYLRSRAAAANRNHKESSSVGGFGKAKACILVFNYGGPSHLETWDPKPDAPKEIRGEFRPIATSVPGIRIGEHLPRCSRIVDRLAIVRSMHHPMRNHNAAAVESLCGRTPLKGDLGLLANDVATDFPCYGGAMNRLARRQGDIPTSVALPHVMYNVVVLPGQTAGFLGA